MLNPNGYLFTQQQAQAPQFKAPTNPNPGEWYNPYLELGQGYYQPDSEVKEDAPTEEVKKAVEEEDNSIQTEMAAQGFDPFGNPIRNWVQDKAWDVWKNTQGSWLPGANIAHNIAGNVLKTDAAGFGWETGPLKTVQQDLGMATDEQIKTAIDELNDSGYTPTYEDEDNSLPGPGTVWENSYNETQKEANEKALGGWDDGSVFVNTGGMPMRNPMIAYRQVGGPATPPPQGAPIEPTAPVPPAPAAPQAPATPPPVPRKSFAEKVAEAKAALRGEMGLGGPKPEGPQMAPADGQGDSGILDPGGIFEPSQSELGPDMAFQDGTGATIGADDIDGHLPEGAMVMNPEASEMFAEELQAMARGGYV